MHKTEAASGGTSSEEEAAEMNFTPFSSGGGAGGAAGGAHYVTAPQFPAQVAKFQQGVQANGISTVVMSDGGVQYVRTLEGGAALQQTAPQIITLPFALPGAEPGDPQQTMQIQVLAPGLLQQGVQQPKYHMQIPIQGFQQGLGAVLTVAYTPETMESLQLLSNSVSEGAFRIRQGMQVVTLQPQDLQLLQQQSQQHDNKEQQAILIPNHPAQPQDRKKNNNSSSSNNNNNNNKVAIEIKQECDVDTHDEESSELGEQESNSESGGGGACWQISANQGIANYLSKIPQQPALPVSLQQFLRLNPDCVLKRDPSTDSFDGDNAMDGNTEEEAPPKPKKKKKYKKKPLKPARPKPGQVVIAEALDGTPIFCCPECHMAYPEKEQLELHLGVHKIERRFICGICGAGLKRKEHLERHKLGHNPERPYVCSVCNKGFKRKEHLNLHTVIHSGEKTEVCQECGKGFYRKDHLRKHARSHARRGERLEEPVPIMAHPVSLAAATPSGGDTRHTVMPEITIHVPTGGNMQVPVQISVPHHIVSTLPNGEQHVTLAQPRQQQQHQHQQHHIDVDELLA